MDKFSKMFEYNKVSLTYVFMQNNHFTDQTLFQIQKSLQTNNILKEINIKSKFNIFIFKVIIIVVFIKHY